MLDKSPRLFVGPMSKEIVDLEIEYSNKSPLGLIPSRRQVENTGGYVNNWTTKSFANYVKSSKANVTIVRDHGGPLQGSQPDNGLESLREDIGSGFDLVHIDPWKESKTDLEGIKKTVELIEFSCDLSDTCRFEVGTEASIYPYDESTLEMLLRTLEKKLGENFSRVDYAVVQSGVQISGTKNIGQYNPGRLREMTKICKKFGVVSKEHNGDYLSQEEIKSRVQNGLQCINIAPEFGVIQTKELVKCLTQKEYVKLANACLMAKKYEKWLPVDQEPTAKIITEVSGHYVFADTEISEIIDRHNIKEKMRNTLYARFDEIISCWKTSP